MSRFRSGLGLLLCLSLLVASSCTAKTASYTASYYDLFDTYSYLTVYGISESEFQTVSDALHTYLMSFHELTDIYHDYDGVVGISTLNHEAGLQAVTVDPLLFDFLVWCREAYDATGGLVNVALGPVTALWHEAREVSLANPDEAYVPSEEALRAADRYTSIDNLVLNRTNYSAYLSDKNASLDVGALAKGYAGRLAVAFLQEQGIENFILSLGGNVCAFGQPLGTGRDSFRIGIEDPDGGTSSSIYSVSDACVVTSGDYQRYYEVDGVRYHHIIDPTTLYPSTLHHSVTVIHSDSATADLLSTALFLLSEEDGQALAAAYGAQVIY